MNSKKDKFIKFDETIINGKKRIVLNQKLFISKVIMNIRRLRMII